MEAAVVAPASDVPAFIDFVNLTDSLEHPRPEDFPVVGTMLDAVVLDFMPWGELRLAARPSSLTRQRLRDSTTQDKEKPPGDS
ncbi:hypothetical protein [Streptomyces sp. NBC_01236]|uniref:hypothetical protein n=1 Tax=Streptomyces sp. NBC_01236 TaxID=2903789 RepID=UPI002E106084|nr:hypothetical protein OG324_02015 [Streptomyces sp. NBC_01236]